MRIHLPLITGLRRPGLAVTAAAALGPLVVLGAAPASAAARTAGTYSFTVTSTADSHDADPGNGVCADSQGRCTLRAAIEEASADPSGSTITIGVPAGTYDLTLGSLAETANTITVSGAAPASTVIDAGGSSGVLEIDSKVSASLTGLTITGGNAGPSGYGGGVLSSGKTKISDSVISGNSASAGGGIANSGGTLTIKASTVSGNDATAYGGGGIQNGGRKNLAGSVTVKSSTINNNTASGDGGGILNGQNGHPATDRSAAAAPRSRPAAAPDSRPAAASLTLTVSGSKINNNTSDNAGGAIANDGGTATVTGSKLAGNTCPHAIGGGIETYGPLTVTESTLTGNTAAGGYGGGIEAYYGGVAGSTTISQSTLSGNNATIGGGIDDSTTVNVSQSTLSGNSAHQAGGGIEVEGSSTINVVNSTLTANTTAMPGNGGGIQTYACSGGTVSYTTISGNSTGLDLSCSTVQVTGTIVASSTGGANCIGSAPTESAGYNLDSGKSCGFSKSTDLSSTNPDLGPLANNGGPTKTELPQPGSPAINNGGTRSTGCPKVDQRGDPRPSGPACDIGSVEVQR
jgi:CSLREA domain-containing protein